MYEKLEKTKKDLYAKYDDNIMNYRDIVFTLYLNSMK